MEILGTIGAALGALVFLYAILAPKKSRKVDLKRQAEIRARKKALGNPHKNSAYAYQEHFEGKGNGRIMEDSLPVDRGLRNKKRPS
jgi:hypothetical protein